MSQSVIHYISTELKLNAQYVGAVLELLGEGATVPFIARYRKEKTGSLDEVQILAIKTKLDFFEELSARKNTIIKTITELGKLTPELESLIVSCMDKQQLEDIYLPYKPRKMTRADVAIEQGLLPLAEFIMTCKSLNVPNAQYLDQFLNEDKILTHDEALLGAQDIIAQKIADDARYRSWLRVLVLDSAQVVTNVTKAWKGKSSKFEMYYDFQEPLKRSAPHRLLAIRRGDGEKVLSWKLGVDEDHCISFISSQVVRAKGPFHQALVFAIQDGYKRLLFPSIEKECFNLRLEEAEKVSIDVFADNLKKLLLASPAGTHMIIGVDPGFRTGCKCVAISDTGVFCENITLYPTQDEVGSEKTLVKFLSKYPAKYIAIGNGTASKETESFIRNVLKKNSLSATVIVVNESGASIYSASELAREEFPDLDLTVRGSISIARRLQDPLAELIKIDPKSIGVGQYQHDVDQKQLQASLDFVVEYCVNYVGVDLNTASAALLAHVSGIGSTLAQNIVRFRLENGSFMNRNQLKKVTKLGPKAFEQCAGFLRIRDGKNILDNTAIHPESYDIVTQIAQKQGLSLSDLISNHNKLDVLNLSEFVTKDVGLPTLKDIVAELKKPGRDPRAEFTYATFREDVNDIKDLAEGMILEGVVTNVTAFGAFVDIGVHQDGLIHISKLSNTFVKDPNTVISVGEKVSVKVLEADVARKRISLQRML